mgnify:CR=1 FL=1
MKFRKLFGVVMFVMMLVPSIANAGKFEVCINGIDISTGKLCVNRPVMIPQQITATSHDAIHIIMNGQILSSGFDMNGNALFVVHYTAPIAKYVLARNQVFNCTVSSGATEFLCKSWYAK